MGVVLLIMNVQNQPIVWHGQLMLKNDSAQVQMYFVAGNRSLLPLSLPEGTVRIVQRMRLEANQLEQVSKRMKVGGSMSHVIIVIMIVIIIILWILFNRANHSKYKMKSTKLFFLLACRK